MKSENASPSGTRSVYLYCAEMATPLKMASTSAMAATISMLLPFIVSTPAVCFRIATSSHVGVDRTQQDNEHAPHDPRESGNDQRLQVRHPQRFYLIIRPGGTVRRQLV